MNDYKFNIGDVVITVDGKCGVISDICECERCKARGFCEPVWVDEYDDEHFITVYDFRRGFEGFYKIGNYKFNPVCKDHVESDIAYHEATLAQLKKQLQLINEIELTEGMNVT